VTGMVRTATALVLSAVLSVAVGWGVASAHTTRISTDPGENAALTVGPHQVSATFDEPLQTTFAAMTVVGPDAHLWSADGPRVAGAVLSVAVRPLGPAGTYTVHYRVTSADGHPVSGSWSFRLSLAGTGTPGPRADAGTPSTGGNSVWPFAVGALVIVAAAGLWAALRRRA
jgi:LPXTG-motif cell wall-anchored protein